MRTSASVRGLLHDGTIALLVMPLVVGTVLFRSLPAEAASPPRVCEGDCDGDGLVAVSEAVVCIQIGLGQEDTGRCAPCDPSRNAAVEVDELLTVVANSLTACRFLAPRRERTLTIADTTGEPGAGPDETRSGFFSTAGGGNIATRIEADDVRLVPQPNPFGNGDRVSLRLGSDVVVAVQTSTATRCLRLLAGTRESNGFIDCRTDRRFDVVLEEQGGLQERSAEPQATNEPDVQPGGVFLSVMQQRAVLPAGANLSECRVAQYTEPVQTYYVSGKATASKGDASIGPIAGETFDCDNFSESDGFGMLVGPLVEFDTQLGDDVANVLRLADSGEFRPTPTLSFPTPTPTATPDERPICGNGSVDPNFGEECDPAATANPACSGGERCVCCLCLEDEETLGERTLTVRRPQSAYLSTALVGSDISVGPWLAEPLVFEGGRPDDMLPSEDRCSATLRLRDDAVLGFHDPLQNVVCIKLFADGSEGFIDCDGGRPADVDISIDSHGAGEEGEIVFTDSGSTGQPGAAKLRIARAVTIVVPPPLPNSSDPAEICPRLNYDDPFDPSQIKRFNIDLANITVLPIVLTTGTTQGTIHNPIQGGREFPLTVSGESFRCDAFSLTDGPGTLVGNSPKLDDPLAGVDVMNALKLAD
jgi:hypothetical protein